MQSQDKNFIVMGLLLGLAGAVSLGVYLTDFRQTEAVQIKDFPRTAGAWAVSEDIPLSAADKAILETDNAFIRKYKNPQGQEVYLYLVYSQTNHKAFHPPEICYIGEGVSIIEKTRESIPVNYKNLTINANRLLLEAGPLYQISFYWFKVGDIFTSSYWKEQVLVAFNALLGKRQGSALIRVSADLAGQNQETAVKEIKEFTNSLVPQLFSYLS